MPRSNLISLFADFRRYAREVAVVQRRGYRRETWTYAKLASVAYSATHDLRERGVGTGDRVVLWGANSAEWMAAFWACLLLGAVAVPMDDGATTEFVARMLRETSARVIVGSRDKIQQFGGTAKPLDPLGTAIPRLALEELPDRAAQRRIVVRASDPRRPDAALHETFSDEPITRNHIAQILFTSGTTGEPRGVVLTHGNFLANLEPLERGIDPYRKYERWFHPLRFVSLVPLSHVFGQFMALFVPPLLGAAVVLENSASPSEIIRTTKRERATALIAVPRMLDALSATLQRDFRSTSSEVAPPPKSSQPDAPGCPILRAPASSSQPNSQFDNTFLAAQNKKFLRRAWLFRRIHRRLGWKFWAFISGGAALSGETEEFFKRIGYAVVQGYGMTETASLISLNHPFRATQGSIGRVLPGREFKLAEDGEILLRGESISAGYWQSGALRPSADEAWLHTGDFGELDTEGNLRFRGRKKNVIVTSAGLNIYPEDLEGALRRQPDIRDAVVIPIARSANAEPCAILLPTGQPAVPGSGAARGTPSRHDANFQQPSRALQCAKPDDPLATSEAPRPLTEDAMAVSARQAVDAANQSLAEYQQIRAWLIWPDPDFPRTSTGKPRLAEITARAQQMLTGAQTATATPNSLQDLIARFAVYNPSDHLEQTLNLTSLDRVELLSALEQRYQVELSETAFAEAKTVSDIETLLRQGSEPGSASAAPSREFGGMNLPIGVPNLPDNQVPLRPTYCYPRWTQRQPIRLLRLAIYYALVYPATQLLGHPKIVGRENLREAHGPLLIVSNHVTRRADIGLILAALPPRYRHKLAIAMGGETLRQMRTPPQSWFFARRWAYQLGYWLVTALFNVFPLPQFSGFRESFRFAGESIDRGYSVLVFPEGETNESGTGEMAKFQPGVGLLAQNLRVPIVPMRLDGIWQMKRERRRFAHLGELIVRIGQPVTFSPVTPPGEIADSLFLYVNSLYK